jgi:hypothetical protein
MVLKASKLRLFVCLNTAIAVTCTRDTYHNVPTAATIYTASAAEKFALMLLTSLCSHTPPYHRQVEALESELVDSRLSDARTAAVHSEVEQELLAMRDACAALVQQRATLCDEVRIHYYF